MKKSIPENLTQCTFNFDVLSTQPVEDFPLSVNPVLPHKKQNLRSDFYTYTLIRSDTGQIFYVGKGQKSRMKAHISNAKRHGDCNHKICNTIRKLWREGHDVIHEKIADGIPEADALALEKLFISLGAVYNWPLVNLSWGGEIGPTGRIVPPDEQVRRTESVSKAWSDPALRQEKGKVSKALWQEKEFRARVQAGFTPEARERINANRRGKPNDGLAKTYPGFISPLGIVYEQVSNLHTFCQEHNLQVSNMCLVAQGKQYDHKGWTCYPPIEKPAKRFAPPKTAYTGFVGPDGQVYHVTTTLKDFCKEHELTLGAMSNVNAGKWASHKGWTKYQP